MHQTINPMIWSLSENNQISIKFDQKYQKTIKKQLKPLKNNNFQARQRSVGAAEGGALVFFNGFHCFLIVFDTFTQI